jgi:GNAT superfamily N-acetyltransferase
VTAVVRSAEPRDFSVIESIENAADELLIERFEPADWPRASSGADRATEPGFLLVAELGENEVAGFVHVLEAGDICHVEQLSVAPAYARQGVGRALLEAAQQLAGERGYRQISLRTYADVPWNAPFYTTAGFIEAEPETEFHRSLTGVDAALGLDAFGRRIHMVATLD